MPRLTAGRIIAALLLLLTALVAVGIWMGLGALTAYERLTSARETIAQLQSDVAAGNISRIDDEAAALRDDTAEARDALDTWAWGAAEHLPAYGDDVRALRTLVAVTDDLAAGPAESLARAATTLTADRLAPVDGRIPLEPLREAAPAISRGYEGLLSARRDLREVDTRTLEGPLAEAVQELRSEVAVLVDRVAIADRITTLLPPMLGGDGPRRYLLLNQNTAEARALGGIAGSAIIVEADDGRIQLRRQVTGGSLDIPDEPIIPLSAAELSLFGTSLGRFFVNSINTPDFPRAAELASAHWEANTGQEVDGVLAVDPEALSLLLEATGPVTVGGIELRPENAASVLLRDAYARLPDPAEQDEFFASAARAVFDRLSAGKVDAAVAARALDQAAEEGRLLAWSRRRTEEQQLLRFPIAGALDGLDGGRPEVGIFRFENTASKLSYYQEVSVISGPDCAAEATGARTRLEIDVTSTVPRSRAARRALPDYVALNTRPRGTMRTRLYLYAPPGSAFGPVTVDGRQVGVISVLHDGLFVVAVDLVIRPQATVRIETSMSGGELRTTDPRALTIRTTPTALRGQFTHQALECR